MNNNQGCLSLGKPSIPWVDVVGISKPRGFANVHITLTLGHVTKLKGLCPGHTSYVEINVHITFYDLSRISVPKRC